MSTGECDTAPQGNIDHWFQVCGDDGCWVFTGCGNDEESFLSGCCAASLLSIFQVGISSNRWELFDILQQEGVVDQ